MKKKPIIGVVPLVDIERDSLWMLPGYMDGITEAGGLPVILPLTTDMKDIKQLVEQFDGFLFTGGQDVGPALYGEDVQYDNVISCSERDILEDELLQEAFHVNKPILGICRGLQLMNASLGGTLYQDLGSQYKSDIKHRMEIAPDQSWHKVKIVPDTLLSDIIKIDTYGVNSLHHQAVKKLSLFLKACAISEDGIIEGAYCPEKKFVLGVQWHPEFSYKKDVYAKEIFNAFVASAMV